jgi:hypothetical protein
MKNLLIIAMLALTITVQAQSEKSNKSATDKKAIENLINEYGEQLNQQVLKRY